MSEKTSGAPANPGQSATANTAPGSDQANKLPNPADPAGTQTTSPGETGEQDRQFSQADVDRIVGERLERERAKAEKEADKARKAAEEASLAEQQKFQELANKRQERIGELEEQLADLDEIVKRADRYEKALRGYRDAMLDGVPESVQTLLKGQDIAEQLEWLSANASQFTAGGTSNGNGAGTYSPAFPSTPAPIGGAGSLTADEKRRRAYQPRL